MKKTVSFFSIAMLLLFVGCKSEDDGLTTDSFKTKAILQGNVYYSQGQDFIKGKYLVDKRVKASGKTIYLDVQSSEYKPGSTGVITYTAKVDTTGNYTFTVPVKAQGSTTGIIRLEQFLGTRQVYDQMVAGVPTVKSEQVVFSFTKNISLSNGSLRVENISYGFSPVDIPTTYTDTITLKGTLNLAYEKGFRDGAFKAASGKTVEIAVDYPELGRNLNFGTSVDQNGNYSIQIPVISREKDFNASILPVGYVVNDYIHFNSSSTQLTLNGIYTGGAAQTINIPSGKNIKNDYTVNPMTLFFVPTETPSTWNVNLAGWVQLDPSIYKYPVTLTGNVLAAIEKSYLVGDYNPLTGRTVKVTVNMGSGYVTQSYIVSTDNAGKYTVPIEVPQKNMNISVAVNTDTCGVSNYTHYMADGTSVQLNGWYQTSCFNITNQPITISEFYTAYAIDNLYRVFQPVDVSSVKNWNSNLFGWYKVAGNKGSIAVSGTVKQAVEGAPNTLSPTAWATAAWGNSANQPFSISVGGKTLIGITNSLGQYSLAFPVDFAVGSSPIYNLNISISSSIGNVIDFNHYSTINTVTPTQIQGSYYGMSSSSGPYVSGAFAVNCYMFFLPTTTPAGWSNYSWKIN